MLRFIDSISDNAIVKSALTLALVLGVYKLTTFSLSLVSLVADLWVLPPVNFATYGAGKANWAVVTGASDGIGKEYALQLAAKGLNIVLVSRTKSKLDALADDIAAKFKVKTKVLAFDVALDKQDNYDALAAVIAELPVTVLVNNVGQSHSIPVPFLETDERELRNIITINTTATLKITQVVAPRIVHTVAGDKKNIRGLILNMGSFGGLLPTPYLAVYSGSKAFLQQWSAALSGELLSQGVDVELVVSYLVTSAMSKIRRSSATIPNPRVFVRSVLRNAGRRAGAQERYATSTPYWAHAFMHFGIENTVGVYSKLANTMNLGMHKSIRSRALKKAAKKKEQ